MFQYRCLPWLSIVPPAFHINVFESRACMRVRVCLRTWVRAYVRECVCVCVCSCSFEYRFICIQMCRMCEKLM